MSCSTLWTKAVEARRIAVAQRTELVVMHDVVALARFPLAQDVRELRVANLRWR
jgi:hypothetical protein